MTRQYVSGELRRRQIAEAALLVLAEHGVGGFTTRAIAERVGITDGTLFRHFSDKKEVVLAAMDRLEEELLVDLVADGPPIERLERMFRRRAAFVGSHDSVGRLIFSEELVHLAGEPGRAKVAGWRSASLGFLLSALTEARAAGATGPDIEPRSLVPVVQGMLLTFALHGHLGLARTPSELALHIDDAWRTLRTLLFPSGPEAP